MPCRKNTIGDHLILPSHQCIYCNGITMVGYNSQYRTISRKYFSNSVDFGLYVVLGQVDWLPCYCITSSEYAWRWILGKFYNYYCGTDCTCRVYCIVFVWLFCRVGEWWFLFWPARTRRNHSESPVFISPHCGVRTISVSASQVTNYPQSERQLFTFFTTVLFNSNRQILPTTQIFHRSDMVRNI